MSAGTTPAFADLTVSLTNPAESNVITAISVLHLDRGGLPRFRLLSRIDALPEFAGPGIEQPIHGCLQKTCVYYRKVTTEQRTIGYNFSIVYIIHVFYMTFSCHIGNFALVNPNMAK
jgi:hypothetical protein